MEGGGPFRLLVTEGLVLFLGVFPLALHRIFAVLPSTAESHRGSECLNTGVWGSLVLGFGRAGFFATSVFDVKETLSGVVLGRTFLAGTLSFGTRAFSTRAFSAGAFSAGALSA